VTKYRKLSRLWAEIKQHPAWYILGVVMSFVLWALPVGFLQSWPSLVRNKSVPEWLAERGFSLTELLILWLAVSIFLTVAAVFVIILRVARAVNDDISPVLTAQGQGPKEPLPPKPAKVKELEQRYEIREIQPNLIFRQYSMVGAHQEAESIVEGNNGRDLTFHAVVAEFNNRVDSERITAPIDKVSATLTYTFFDKRTPIEINRGIWLSHGSRVDFGVNDTHRLMIATLEGDFEERFVYALNGSYSSTEPKRLRLSEPLVKVKVALVGESRSKVITQFDFMLEVSRDSEFLANLRLTELTRWKHDQLFDLLVRGNNLLNKYEAQKNFAAYGGLAAVGVEEAFKEIEREADFWSTETSKFLATHFSEQHQFRFIKAVSATKGQKFYDFAQTCTKGLKVVYETIREVGGIQPDTKDLSRIVKTFGPIFPGL
jgi:hypothetical protein